MYNEVEDLKDTTHLLIYGKDGNIEIVELDNITDKVKPFMEKVSRDFLVNSAQFLFCRLLITALLSLNG